MLDPMILSNSKPAAVRPIKLKKSHLLAIEMVHSLLGQAAPISLADDPIYYVHQYADPLDQEIVALISSEFAFGQVKSIHLALRSILEILGPSPYQTLLRGEALLWKKLAALPGHRWIRGADVKDFCFLLHHLLNRHGSLKDYILPMIQSSDPDVGGFLQRLMAALLSEASSLKLPVDRRGFRYFFVSPEDGSPCKRWNMFLRWVVRPKDGIDLGLWSEIGAEKLIIPLDTHIHQFAKRFKISAYQNTSWKMAQEITSFLKHIRPEDPVSLDYAICHYGMRVGW